MNKEIMKNILISLGIIVAVGAVVAGGTVAYFTDTEISVGNTFTAGSIDLSNGLKDVKFTVPNMKPGDMGQGKYDISVSSTSSPYWACMKSTITGTPENGMLEMEADAGDETSGEGELQEFLSFYVWNDREADGIYKGAGANFPSDSGRDRNLFGPLTLVQLQQLGSLPLADSTGTAGPSFFSSTPLVAGTTYHLGYAYCFGKLENNDYTNITCSGAGPDTEYNRAQTDGVVGTIEFSAVQSENNLEFTCPMTP